jgi:hypothetical protein
MTFSPQDPEADDFLKRLSVTGTERHCGGCAGAIPLLFPDSTNCATHHAERGMHNQEKRS